MKAQSNGDYYNILLEACKEAFEVLEQKDFLFTNEAMIENDEISFNAESIELFGIEKSNDTIVQYRLKEAMTYNFLTYLERQYLLLKRDMFFERKDFYRKCLTALNIEFTKFLKEGGRVPKDYNCIKNPNVLLFLESMKFNIKERAEVPDKISQIIQSVPIIINQIDETIKPKIINPKEDISNYFDAYYQSVFSVVYKRNDDKSINEFYNGNYFAYWNKQVDEIFFENKNLEPIYKDLESYNAQVRKLFIEIISLFKVVDGYKKTQKPNYHTQIRMRLDNINEFLSFNKKISRKIKKLIIDRKFQTAIDMKNYCAINFTECIDSLEGFGIYIDKSPLKTDFENALSNIENSINLTELQCLIDKPQQLEAVIPDKKNEPQQVETNIPDEVKKDLHANIFVDDSFKIWQKMFEDFNIDASKRTDLDFMFAIMKYNNLIHENIGLINMQNWINKKHQITIEKLKYTDVNTKANQKRMTVYNLIKSKQ